jgi:hypothetical protein
VGGGAGDAAGSIPRSVVSIRGIRRPPSRAARWARMRRTSSVTNSCWRRCRHGRRWPASSSTAPGRQRLDCRSTGDRPQGRSRGAPRAGLGPRGVHADDVTPARSASEPGHRAGTSARPATVPSIDPIVEQQRGQHGRGDTAAGRDGAPGRPGSLHGREALPEASRGPPGGRDRSRLLVIVFSELTDTSDHSATVAHFTSATYLGGYVQKM